MLKLFMIISPVADPGFNLRVGAWTLSTGGLKIIESADGRRISHF